MCEIVVHLLFIVQNKKGIETGFFGGRDFVFYEGCWILTRGKGIG
jgi:hypothetical protein